MNEYRELLLGCGYSRERRVIPPMAIMRDDERRFVNVTTVDANAACKPDVIANLDSLDWRGKYIEDNFRAWYPIKDTYDEIHAYELLEHLGTQGDFASFFRFFSVAWYTLKPDGFFCATVPSRFSPWLWGDPGHRRAILPESLVFLCQPEYTKQLGNTSMSDYRHFYREDFDIVQSIDDRVTHSFILRAVKPSRISL